ncbi:MAG: hypothetical protein COA44_12855 [Arcobacter sp.]|nr:MAG: hypothetical protein COA44_12855 [Arcobacter sp.]
MTKDEQLSSKRLRPKVESTFGKISNGSFGKVSKGDFGKVSKGNFGKQASNGSFGKTQSIIKAKPKAKASELSYLSWLHEDAQMSSYTCMVCNLHVQDWHHVKLSSSDKKNHKKLIPLCKAHHVGNKLSPHGTPTLWRETYSMLHQNKLADDIYNKYKEHLIIQ